MSLDFFRSSKESIQERDIPEKKIEGTHIMDIYYPDGTKHHVDCYKFAKAVLDDGEEVYFIEYKDYDNKKYGEYADSYGIVVNKNGKWQKSERKLDYKMLSSREIEKYDPKVLGEDLQMEHISNTQSYEQPESILNEHKIAVPQTQTQPQRDKKPPIKNNNVQNDYITAKEDEYVPQTQTQPLREEIPPHHQKEQAEKREIFICVPTDEAKTYVNIGEVKSRGLVYNGIKNVTFGDNEINDNWLEFSDYQLEKNFPSLRHDLVKKINMASFEIFDLSEEVLRLLDQQTQKLPVYDNISRMDYCFAGTWSFKDLQKLNIETDDAIYKFIPSILNFPQENGERLDVLLGNDDMNKSPEQLLEGFLDYSIPMGRIVRNPRNFYGDVDSDTRDHCYWIGYTKDVEIERLRKECEYLRSMNKSYQAQLNTQESIQEIEDRKLGGIRR